MSGSWSGGSTRAWRRIRAQVLARDAHRCQLRLDGCTTRAQHVHHTRPRELVGDDPAHLQAACEHCNLKAGDPRTVDPPPRPKTWW